MRPLEYFESDSSNISRKDNDTGFGPVFDTNLFEVLFLSKYVVVIGVAYSLKLSLDWHQRNVLINQLGTREPFETGFTPVQIALAKRNRKL